MESNDWLDNAVKIILDAQAKTVDAEITAMLPVEEKPKKKHGPSAVIIPKKINQWLNQNQRETRVNSWKKGGGHSHNGRDWSK